MTAIPSITKTAANMLEPHAGKYADLRLAVLGSGICGVTLANTLLDNYPEANVTIYTNEQKNIVTFAACAQFYPIWIGENLPLEYDNLLKKWFLSSKEKFFEHAQEGMTVRHMCNYELFTGPTEPPKYFYDVLSNFEVAENSCLPLGYSYQYTFETMIINPIEYLPHLIEKFTLKGGNFVHKEIIDLDDVLALPEETIF